MNDVAQAPLPIAKHALRAFLRVLGLLAPAQRALHQLRSLKPEAIRERRRMTAFYAGFVRPGSLCFDVGANVGNRTEVFLGLGARVVCIEPQASCVRTLRNLFGSNPKAIIVAEGASDRPGTAELSISQASAISTISEKWRNEGRFSAAEWARTETIRLTTLDRLIETHGTPDFCKIDVEGAEVRVLSGLSRPITALSFEFTREFISDAKNCADHLLSIGAYEFNASLAESMELASERWVGRDELFATLNASGDPFLWGDVYARVKHAGS